MVYCGDGYRSSMRKIEVNNHSPNAFCRGHNGIDKVLESASLFIDNVKQTEKVRLREGL